MEEQEEQSAHEGIAIIGISGRFPGADSVEQFWQNLVAGIDSISHFSEDALEYSVATPEAIAEGNRFVRARGIIEGVDLFDADFFGMYPKEAQIIDPQHRLFLECAWEALESAGHAPANYPGLIGVYAGLSMNTYFLHNLCTNREFAAEFSANYQVSNYQTMLGNDKDFMPTRTAYKLNLRGPCMTIQSACSTSLVAICQACSSLLTYQCDMALAGGVSITFPQKRDYRYQEEAIVSADGSCRSFDAGANGTVFGHGVAVVLLKRLEDAISDGDHVLAVIKGFAVNNDGTDKISYAAPSVTAQADVISMAQAVAGIHPDTISYIEAHGTATPLGDPIEVAGLTSAFRRGGTTRNQYCALGTGKTHIGHLDVAAGATGLIKTVLQLQHELIPPLLHFETPNPKIDFENSPFFPVSKPIKWQRGATPRRAGVSAFGIGGTNAHVVVEEAPVQLSGPSRKSSLLLLSAKTPTALKSMSTRLADYLEGNLENSLADIAFTLQQGRQRFKYRQALCAENTKEAAHRLKSFAEMSESVKATPSKPPSLVFLFPGQGAQYVDMGRELYDSERVFRDAVDRCAECLMDHLQFDIRTVIYPGADSKALAEQQINETRVTQPAIFTVEYALASLWLSWGIKPTLLIGHSVGEYVAAVLAEALSLEDALWVLAGRAKMMQDLPPGSMLAVRKGASELEPILPAGIAVAAINSPRLTTLSGPTQLVQNFQETLEASGIVCRPLATSHAFHSAMMDPILEPFTELAAQVKQKKPNLPWISTVTGTWMSDTVANDASYWAGQLRHSVRFYQAIETAILHGETVFLEVGPGRALTQLVLQQPSKPEGLTALVCLTNSDGSGSDLASVLTAMGRLWCLGIEPDWNKFYAEEVRLRTPLPTYPFERKSYWVAPPVRDKSEELGNPAPSKAKFRNSMEPARSNSALNSESAFAVSNRSEVVRVIEKQVQLLEQQLEMIQKQALARRSNGDQ